MARLKICRAAELPPAQEDQDRPLAAKIPLDAALTLKALGRVLAHPLRPRPFPRRGGLLRASSWHACPRAPSLRHAFEPAAAARELRVHEVAPSQADLRPDGAIRPQELPGRHRHLQGPHGQGPGRRVRRQGRPHRECPRFPRPEGRPWRDRAPEARAGPGRREDHSIRRELRALPGRIAPRRSGGPHPGEGRSRPPRREPGRARRTRSQGRRARPLGQGRRPRQGRPHPRPAVRAGLPTFSFRRECPGRTHP